MTQVALNSVNKTFGKTHVIRNVDLEIEKANSSSLLDHQVVESRRFYDW